MVRPRRPPPVTWPFGLVVALALTLGCHRGQPPPPATKALPVTPPRSPRATLFDHAMLAGTPARPRPDCSPEALMAAARHVGELELLASGAFKAGPRGSKADAARCPTPEAQLAINELRGALPDRVASCMSQDAPFDAEWDMVNSAVIALDACVDCGRAKVERAARCRWVADQARRAEQSVKARMGK